MQAQSWMMVKILLNRFHQGSAETFLKALPVEDAKMILSQDILSQDVNLAIPDSKELIKKVHYSWLVSPIQEFPSPIQEMMLEALPESHSVNMAKMLKKTKYAQNLSPIVKTFLSDLLYSKIGSEVVLPMAYLPVSSLNDLIELNKTELVRLIDFLSMQDLAEAVRFIVDKKMIKKIYEWLSPRKQRYLKICLHQKDKLRLPKLEIEQCGQNFEKLDLILHRRGLLRFAKALSGQHPDLIWHLTHILDTGRGSILKKQYSKESIPGITPVLTQQLTNLMNFLKNKE